MVRLRLGEEGRVVRGQPDVGGPATVAQVVDIVLVIAKYLFPEGGPKG